jgi:hypothetical protein
MPTHWCITVRSTLQIKINQLFQVGSHDLIRVHKNDFLQVHGEKDIQEQNLVSPNDTLLFLLCA